MPATIFADDRRAFLLEAREPLRPEDIPPLEWLLSCPQSPTEILHGRFIGPRKEIVSPWSTNATEIITNMGISGVTRIECDQSCVLLGTGPEEGSQPFGGSQMLA